MVACSRLLVVCGCLRSFFSGLWSFVVVFCRLWLLSVLVTTFSKAYLEPSRTSTMKCLPKKIYFKWIPLSNFVCFELSFKTSTSLKHLIFPCWALPGHCLFVKISKYWYNSASRTFFVTSTSLAGKIKLRPDSIIEVWQNSLCYIFPKTS